MLITKKGEKMKESKNCCFCVNPFYEEEEGLYEKNEDHCQTEGTYRGAAHTPCILESKTRMFIDSTNSFKNYDKIRITSSHQKKRLTEQILRYILKSSQKLIKTLDPLHMDN